MSRHTLFTPLQVGSIRVPNRIFMAPMTRARSLEPGDVPTALMAEYYRQRASAGLIITEATQISFDAKGWPGAPGIHTPEQLAGWQAINRGVHDAGGHIAVQVWHTGRVSHSSLQPDHQPPFAPSAIAPKTQVHGRDADGRVGAVDAEVPRALNAEGIRRVIDDFGRAAANARTAGFDLVELHGAHGYLIHQFLSPAANQRTDRYGGGIENRARFALEAIDAAIAHWAADRVGFRIYPLGPFNGIDDGTDQEEDALYLIGELAKRHLAYLHISEPDWVGGQPFSRAFREAIRDRYPGVIIGAGSYTPEKAEALIHAGLIDAVAFGRWFLANPDLPRRLQRGAPLNPLRREGMYGGDANGYTDYPCLAGAETGSCPA